MLCDGTFRPELAPPVPLELSLEFELPPKIGSPLAVTLAGIPDPLPGLSGRCPGGAPGGIGGGLGGTGR